MPKRASPELAQGRHRDLAAFANISFLGAVMVFSGFMLAFFAIQLTFAILILASLGQDQAAQGSRLPG